MKRLRKTLNRIFIRGSSHWLVDVRVNMSLHGRFVSGAKEFVNQLVDCACRALQAHIPLLLCRSALCIIPELSHQLQEAPEELHYTWRAVLGGTSTVKVLQLPLAPEQTGPL